MAQTYVNMILNSPFQGYKVIELRALARERKVKYYYKMKKVDLIVALENTNNIDVSSSITNTKKIEKTSNTKKVVNKTNTKKIEKTSNTKKVVNKTNITQNMINIIDMVARGVDSLHQADEFDEIFNLPTVDIPSPIPATPSVNIPEVFNFGVPLPTEPLPSPANLFISDSEEDDISDILAKINQPVLSEDSSDEEEFDADQVAKELFSNTRRQVSFSNIVRVNLES